MVIARINFTNLGFRKAAETIRRVIRGSVVVLS
jgi:hypothetical protein